jgi:acid phosphatase (class A)
MHRSLKTPILAAVWALCLPFPGWAQAPAPAEAVLTQPWVGFVGPFPKADSDEGKADLAIVLWEQRIRTPAEIQRALAEVKLGPGAYATALGHPVDAARYPRTFELIDRVGRDIKVVTDGLKKHFARVRPYHADPRVQPAIEREPSPSYPSGHATRGVAYAVVLADLVPERREALLAQGRLVGFDRVIGGVHYPSDIEAGQRLGLKLVAEWLADPANRALVEAVRASEWSTRKP